MKKLIVRAVLNILTVVFTLLGIVMLGNTELTLSGVLRTIVLSGLCFVLAVMFGTLYRTLVNENH